MPEFEKEMDRGGFGAGAGAAAAPAAIVSDIFQRVAQLGGVMVVAYIAPVGGGTSAVPTRKTTEALMNIASQLPAAAPAVAAAPQSQTTTKGVAIPKSV